ncbi:conjugal transfer protein TrbE [Lelliottia aquatilis]|uniref:VirB4 family type IV secretion/conjugal transfer ATPase n=1 Tax=Lelliottia aquatilis TaxID=2080838 RepID=UPI00157512D5|nr:conjugal transfer protein TrbE [Lelliottia aquatilis]NTZ47737.1 conjugal transfer protein TrbE [Lelliottia aquatilis]
MQKLADQHDTLNGMAELLNYGAMVDDGIILNKDGSFLAGFSFRGLDIASATKSDRNRLARKMNQALSSLGTGYMTHEDAIRHRVEAYSPAELSHFPHPVFRMMDDQRRAFFEGEHAKFETKCLLWVTYMPPSKGISRLTNMMFEKDNIQRSSPAERNLSRFRDKMKEFEGLLAAFMNVERLKSYRYHEEWRDRQLACINETVFGKHHPVMLPPVPMYLDNYLGNYDFWPGLKPKLDQEYLCCISIDGFPNFSSPNMLSTLDYLSVEYRWNTRFCYYDSAEAKAQLTKEQKKWKQKVVSFKDKLLRTPAPKIDQDALNMVSQYEAALTAASNDEIKYGHYTSTIILRHRDIEQLELDAEEVANCLRNTMGMSCRIESVNAAEAFLGSLPSDSIHNVRRPLLSTLNLAHLSPLSGIWGGDATCPCPFYPEKSPPLMYCAAEGNTPFRLNLHVGDVGHTLLFGPTGAGKSTKLATLIAQFMRYSHAQVYAFDKGNSLFAVSQCGGSHYDIGQDDSPSFSPLADIDDDFKWCEKYIEHLLILQGVTVEPAQIKKIRAALKVMQASRILTMSEFCIQVQDQQIKEAIHYYTQEGRCGDLLDAEHDSTALASLQVFEIETLMKRGDKDMLAVLLYLFRKIERGLTGHPTMIVIDEAWMALSHPVFREMIKEWLKVLRKANCVVILATQSLSDAVNSGMLDVLTESCPTQIFLPNEKAQDDIPRKIYETFGLNSRQIEIISMAIPKRQYYVTSPKGNRLIDLALSPLELAFVGISDKPELRELKSCIQRNPDSWYFDWLKYKGVH